MPEVADYTKVSDANKDKEKQALDELTGESEC